MRFTRFEKKRLAWALSLSLAAHFLAWGGYELGKKTGLWQRMHWPTHAHLAEKKKNPPPPVSDPAIFLDVDPDQATPVPPKNSKYYAARNSQAANPDPDKNSNQPKLNGKQTDIPNTKEVPRVPNTKVQPAPAPQPPSQVKMAAPPPSMMQAGDLKLAKLETSPQKNDTPPRPRTLNQAYAQQQTSPKPQMLMQQNGGTQRRSHIASQDALVTAFSDYDNKFIDAVQSRWYQLLDSQKFSLDRFGQVTLQFRLNYDGTITDMKILKNTVGELLGYVCQQAVLDQSPFEAWPSDMRRKIAENYREMTFTFFYYIDN